MGNKRNPSAVVDFRTILPFVHDLDDRIFALLDEFSQTAVTWML